MAECKYCGALIPRAQGRGKQRGYCNDEHMARAAAVRPKAVLSKCRVDGCSKDANRKGAGLCEAHYAAMRRHGTTAGHYERAEDEIIASTGYVLVKAKGHPRSLGAARAYAHRVAFTEANGEGPFKCKWCKKPVTWRDMHVDHLDDCKTNNSPTNLVASCPGCNTKRGRAKMVRTMREKYGVEHNGQRLTWNEWAEKLGVSRQSLLWRLRNGWSLAKVLTHGRGVTGPKPIG